MYMINTPIAFEIEIAKNDSPPGQLNMLVLDPDGVTSFDSAGAGEGAVYVPPTADTVGSYKFTKTFDTKGIWTLHVGIGPCEGFDSHLKIILNILVPSTKIENTLKFSI